MSTQVVDIQTNIRKMNDQLESLFSRGNAQGVSELYTDEGMLLPPGSDVVRGREFITQFWQGVMNMGIKQVKLETDEIDQYGDTAIELGHYALYVKDGNTVDWGKYIVEWKSSNGQWKLHRDIWNSSMAPHE